MSFQANHSARLAFEGILSCYKEHYPDSKLYLADPPVSVYHGHVSILDADLQCAKQALTQEHKNFDVYVNVAGTELPVHPYDHFESVMQDLGVKNLVESHLPEADSISDRVKSCHYLQKYVYSRSFFKLSEKGMILVYHNLAKFSNFCKNRFSN